MAKAKYTQEGPRRVTARATLSRRQQALRTLDSLQSHLTADVTRQVLDILTAILRGTCPEHELPQKEGRTRSSVRQDKRTSWYRGVKKSGKKCAAQINRGGVRTELGAYDEELTAAIVFQVVDKEYSKVGLPSRRGANLCTNRQPAETFHADSPAQETFTSDMASRPSTCHLETLAENLLLQDQVQTLQKDLRECWSILNRTYELWKREEAVSQRLRTHIERLEEKLTDLDPDTTPLCSPPRSPTPSLPPTPPLPP